MENQNNIYDSRRLELELEELKRLKDLVVEKIKSKLVHLETYLRTLNMMQR